MKCNQIAVKSTRNKSIELKSKRPSKRLGIRGREEREATAVDPNAPVATQFCGDFGGRTLDNEPCPRPAGWGINPKTEKVVNGPCRDHCQEAMDKRERVKERYLMAYLQADRTIVEICEDIDVSPDTLMLWRKEDPEFGVLCEQAVLVVDDIRTINVEDTTYRRIIRGEAAAQETIFWLKNRAPDRWRDKVELEATGRDGQPLVPLAAIRVMVDDGDEQIEEADWYNEGVEDAEVLEITSGDD